MIELRIDKSRVTGWLGSGADGSVNLYNGNVEGCTASLVVKRVYESNPFETELRIFTQIGDIEGIVNCYGYDADERMLVLERHGGTLSEYMHTVSEATFKEKVDSILKNLYNIFSQVIDRGFMPMDVHSDNIIYDRSTGKVTVIDLARYKTFAEMGYYDIDSSLKYLYNLTSNGLIEYDRYKRECEKFDSIILPKIKKERVTI